MSILRRAAFGRAPVFKAARLSRLPQAAPLGSNRRNSHLRLLQARMSDRLLLLYVAIYIDSRLLIVVLD